MDLNESIDPPPEPTESARHALAFIDVLLAAGIRDFVISPGSRSTPLVLALQHFPEANIEVILDERSASFYALGVADCTHRPVALICTSGTAAANYYPAVIEASERRVPLMLLTADRPLELRDCGAGQTIDQVGLFGKFVRWAVDAYVPEGGQGEEYLASVAREGVQAATGKNPGPVHFNLPFREPFLPKVSNRPDSSLAAPDGEIETSPIEYNWEEMSKAGPGLILVGAANPERSSEWTDGIFRISDYLGWPILADVLNPLRHSPGAESRVVNQYEGLIGGGLLERDPTLVPTSILQIGILPTAKRLRQWLAQFEGRRWQWSHSPTGLDPARKPFEWIEGAPDQLGDLPDQFANESFRGNWIDANRRANETVTGWLEQLPNGFEGRLYHELAQAIPKDGQVFIANSMPVRDAERFWYANRPSGPRIFSNRGASGIDGLISMAAGIAANGAPTYAVLGDLSFLHDEGGLKVASQVDGNLTFVVIDNGGGRIFEQLPIRSEAEVFEDYFLTPQSVNIRDLCLAHGIPATVFAADSFVKEQISAPHTGVRVLILETSPEDDRSLREEWKQLFSNL